MATKTHKLDEIKIVFAGLDNAGKTSFLIALRQKYNFYERVKKLKPTIKIDYSSFNFLNRYTVNFWDMGGQAKYRKIYVNNPIYFTSTDYLYFLIDIQDELKYEEAVRYLHDLLDIYRDKEMEYTREVLICFDKYDPVFRENEEYLDRIEMIKKLIVSQNKDINFKFFNMSYYDISSLSKALAYSLSKLLNLEEINVKLERIVKDYDCNYAILYTDSGLIISDYYQKVIDFRDFDKKICRINESLEFFQRLTDEEVEIDEKLTFSEQRSEYVKKYDVPSETGVSEYYLGICAPSIHVETIKKELGEFQKYLKSL